MREVFEFVRSFAALLLVIVLLTLVVFILLFIGGVLAHIAVDLFALGWNAINAAPGTP